MHQRGSVHSISVRGYRVTSLSMVRIMSRIAVQAQKICLKLSVWEKPVRLLNVTEKITAHLQRMRNRLLNGLMDQLPDVRLNGHSSRCLPNTLSVGFPGIDINTLLSNLTEVAASAGAACHVGKEPVSHVLSAMHVPNEYMLGTLRLSVGKHTTEEEIDTAIRLIAEQIRLLTSSHEENAVDYVPSEGIKLTRYTHGMGCACKLRPQQLEEVLQSLPVPLDKNVMVDTRTHDDAAVYRITDEIAIVQTIDFSLLSWMIPIVSVPLLQPMH